MRNEYQVKNEIIQIKKLLMSKNNLIDDYSRMMLEEKIRTLEWVLNE